MRVETDPAMMVATAAQLQVHFAAFGFLLHACRRVANKGRQTSDLASFISCSNGSAAKIFRAFARIRTSLPGGRLALDGYETPPAPVYGRGIVGTLRPQRAPFLRQR